MYLNLMLDQMLRTEPPRPLPLNLRKNLHHLRSHLFPNCQTLCLTISLMPLLLKLNELEKNKLLIFNIAQICIIDFMTKNSKC